MKRTKQLGRAAATGLLLLVAASCADTDVRPFETAVPESIVGYEYLDAYSPLKSYVDRASHSAFRLGVGASAPDYNAKGVVYGLVNSNFDEMTAGNAMKYASCVAEDGSMDFSTVRKFVQNAKEAGITIYGHTLAWHSQQQNKYLNSLIKDKELEINPDEAEEIQDAYRDFKNDASFPFFVMGYEPQIIDGILTVPEYPGGWYQFFIMDGLSTVPGRTYTITARIKGSKEGSLNVQFGNWGALLEKQMAFKDEWSECSVTIDGVTTESSFVVFQPGTYDGTLEIEWLKLSHKEAPAVKIYVNQVENGTMETGSSMASFVVRESGKQDVPGTILEGQGPDGKNCTSITSVANPTNAYDTQFFIYTDRAWEAGERYKISFWYKATAEAECQTQCHGKPGSYLYYQMLPQNPTFTTEWQYYEKTSTIPAEGDGMHSIAFNLNVNGNVVTYYFADISFCTEESANTIPLTDEEKCDTLTWAMDRWVSGMMEACEGYVTAWDVVNEAISGVDADGDGYYDLQSVTLGTVSATDAAENFYWQDYLGHDRYVPTVVSLARKYYAEYGGTEPLRLFINDYNLESDWDDNLKLKSLLHWIEVWESDNVTKIDGIGSQMHVSCYANPSTQQSKEEHVVKMLELLASSGKLVKISELDMSYVDASGREVPTEEMTEEQHHAMSDYYKFIVSKYFEIVPAAQQYGITAWCITDSPAGSGWRAGLPVGLWTEGYARKHVYAGFAEGLAGQ